MNNNKYFDYYKVTTGDTVYEVAKKNNIDVMLLANLNGLNKDDYIYPGQILILPRAGSIIYITTVGDTLSGICSGFKIDLLELTKQNENIYLQPEQLIVYKQK